MDSLPYERLSPAERKQLQIWELAQHLQDVGDEIIALGRLSIDARNLLNDCKKRKRRATDEREKVEADCALIDAQGSLDNIKDRAKTLRELKSVLQTTVRAIPG